MSARFVPNDIFVLALANLFAIAVALAVDKLTNTKNIKKKQQETKIEPVQRRRNTHAEVDIWVWGYMG